MSDRKQLSRRAFFVSGSGALIVSFGLMRAVRAQGEGDQTPPNAPATAVPTEVAEQQPVPSPAAAPSAPPKGITMVQGDTARAPDEGYTAGSKTIQVGGVNVRKAAAEARQALLEMASIRCSSGSTISRTHGRPPCSRPPPGRSAGKRVPRPTAADGAPVSLSRGTRTTKPTWRRPPTYPSTLQPAGSR